MPEQWVNLAKEDKWVGGDVTAIERVGPLKLRFTFQNDGLCVAKYRLVPQGGAVGYAKKEGGRNPRFLGANLSGWFFVKGTRVVEREIALPAAGGNAYQMETNVGGTVQTHDTYQARRVLYYQSVAMNGVNPIAMKAVEDYFWAENDYYVKLVAEHAGETLPFAKHLVWAEIPNAVPAIKKKVKLTRSPIGFTLVWVNYIATKEELDVKQSPAKAVGSTEAWAWNEEQGRLTIKVPRHLWHGLDDDEDQNKAWFDRFVATFHDSEGKKFEVGLGSDNKGLVSLADGAAFDEGGHKEIALDLSGEKLTKVAKIAFILRVNVVEGWTSGTSLSKQRIIVLAAKGKWAARSDLERKKTVLHEIGHMIGMVVDGVGPVPDKPPTHYVYQLHNGPHCSKGATFGERWTGTPQCVMFGADSITEKNKEPAIRPAGFCTECGQAIRKLDLHTLGPEE